MSEKTITILAVTDLHHMGLIRQQPYSPMIRSELAQILLKKVFMRLGHMRIKPDLTLLLGDLIEDGTDRNAYLDLTALHGELMRSGIPYLALPGNHDGDHENFNEIFNTPAGLYNFNGYGVMLFNDTFVNGRECTRSDDDLLWTKKMARHNPNTPLIAVQHAPIYPAVNSHYPYRPVNASDIIENYQRSKVVLSLSGHYHKGQKARVHEGVTYHTVASLSEAPFNFSLITLKGREVEIQELNLTLDYPNLIDVHSHTEYAYCGRTTETTASIALSKALGVSTMCITEHAFQLYFDKRPAMGFKWQSDPAIAQEVWNTEERGRMLTYRNFAAKLRSPFVKIGLEVDLYNQGKLLLAPEDAEFNWDILIGAIHGIEGFEPQKTTQQEAEKLFMRDLALLLEHDIHVLAHPFRFFLRHQLEVPTHLFEAVAELLSDADVAAEINFHTYHPEIEFIRACVARGVKLALASDTHDLIESGEFWPHINLLRQAGITPKMFPKVLFSFEE